MDSKMVVKSNVLIEASYKLSAPEQRIVLFLASQIQGDDEDFKDYHFPVKEFSEMAGLRHKGEYEDVRNITKKLIGRVFSVRDSTGTLQISWLSSAKYLDGEGKVILRFDPGLRPFLLQVKERFTKFSLRLAIQLKSSFSIRIYELLKQYEKLKERTFSVTALREKLGITRSEYPRYGNFKQKVLNVAKKELSEKTDIAFDYEEIKDGRSVGKIRFIIKPHRPKCAPKISPDLVSDAVIIPPEVRLDEAFQKLCLSLPEEFRGKASVEKLILAAYQKHGFDYVARNIEYANSGSNAINPGMSHGKGSNYRNYLAKALRSDYGLAYREDQEASQAREAKAREAKEAATATVRKDQAESQHDLENRERARVYRQSLAPEALASLREEALARLDPTQREHVARKAPGAEILLKLAMDKICLERMKLA